MTDESKQPIDGKPSEFLPCPFCGKTLDNGLTLVISDDIKATNRLVCLCGWASQTFKYKEELRHWFNTRNGIEPVEPNVTFKKAQREISGNVF